MGLHPKVVKVQGKSTLRARSQELLVESIHGLGLVLLLRDEDPIYL
jgi:hypothetical protein